MRILPNCFGISSFQFPKMYIGNKMPHVMPPISVRTLVYHVAVSCDQEGAMSSIAHCVESHWAVVIEPQYIVPLN